jgi:cytochrome c2
MTMHTRFFALFLVLALMPFAWPLPGSAQISIIPGSAARGAVLFREKSCTDCHSAGRTPQAATPMLLATALWNHSPKMWRAQQERNIRPTLDSIETADLFAYFFSLSYFTAPGDPMRGHAVFEDAGCNRCHDTSPNTHRKAGPPISTWSEVSDPLVWSERMWNHSGKVYAELSSNGLPWPRFSPAQMVDLLAYLRMVPESSSQTARFQPGDPELGRLVFESSCESCHSFGGRTAQHKIDLAKRPGPDLLTGYVTAMWNHAPLMRERAGNKFPILDPGDMSNLVAYLFAQRYFYEEGDVERGAQVFESKNCILCHQLRKEQTGAPDLAMATERYSPITIAAAVWRHGPTMSRMMKEQEIPWPEFNAREMSDLIAFLNNRLVISVSGPHN